MSVSTLLNSSFLIPSSLATASQSVIIGDALTSITTPDPYPNNAIQAVSSTVGNAITVTLNPYGGLPTQIIQLAGSTGNITAGNPLLFTQTPDVNNPKTNLIYTTETNFSIPTTSPFSAITILKAGYYKVSYKVSLQASTALTSGVGYIALQKSVDGGATFSTLGETAKPFSFFTSSDTVNVSGFYLLQLNANEAIQFIFITSSGGARPIGYDVFGGPNPQISNLTIELLG